MNFDVIKSCSANINIEKKNIVCFDKIRHTNKNYIADLLKSILKSNICYKLQSSDIVYKSIYISDTEELTPQHLVENIEIFCCNVNVPHIIRVKDYNKQAGGQQLCEITKHHKKNIFADDMFFQEKESYSKLFKSHRLHSKYIETFYVEKENCLIMPDMNYFIPDLDVLVDELTDTTITLERKISIFTKIQFIILPRTIESKSILQFTQADVGKLEKIKEEIYEFYSKWFPRDMTKLYIYVDEKYSTQFLIKVHYLHYEQQTYFISFTDYFRHYTLNILIDDIKSNIKLSYYAILSNKLIEKLQMECVPEAESVHYFFSQILNKIEPQSLELNKFIEKDKDTEINIISEYYNIDGLTTYCHSFFLIEINNQLMQISVKNITYDVLKKKVRIRHGDSHEFMDLFKTDLFKILDEVPFLTDKNTQYYYATLPTFLEIKIKYVKNAPIFIKLYNEESYSQYEKIKDKLCSKNPDPRMTLSILFMNYIRFMRRTSKYDNLIVKMEELKSANCVNNFPELIDIFNCYDNENLFSYGETYFCIWNIKYNKYVIWYLPSTITCNYLLLFILIKNDKDNVYKSLDFLSNFYTIFKERTFLHTYRDINNNPTYVEEINSFLEYNKVTLAFVQYPNLFKYSILHVHVATDLFAYTKFANNLDISNRRYLIWKKDIYGKNFVGKHVISCTNFIKLYKDSEETLNERINKKVEEINKSYGKKFNTVTFLTSKQILNIDS